MMQNKVKLIPKTVYLDADLIKTIDDMADAKIWNFSTMSYVLLQQAVKERLRKRATKENNS